MNVTTLLMYLIQGVVENIASSIEHIWNSRHDVFKNKVVKINDNYFLSLTTFENHNPILVQLPTTESFKEYPIIYSENMVKLLKLQLKIIDAIISVSPQFMNDGLDVKYSALLLSNANR